MNTGDVRGVRCDESSHAYHASAKYDNIYHLKILHVLAGFARFLSIPSLFATYLWKSVGETRSKGNLSNQIEELAHLSLT